jgi:PAS domain-containing protein
MSPISANKKAKETLKLGEQTYRSLFENMLNGSAYCQMLTEDGVKDFIYLAVNDAFETQTGLKDVVGRKASDVIPGIREKRLRVVGNLWPRGRDWQARTI